MLRILMRRSRAKIPMVRPNEPYMPPKRPKWEPLGIYPFQIWPSEIISACEGIFRTKFVRVHGAHLGFINLFSLIPMNLPHFSEFKMAPNCSLAGSLSAIIIFRFFRHLQSKRLLIYNTRRATENPSYPCRTNGKHFTLLYYEKLICNSSIWERNIYMI